jgi:hypothetical protein
LARNAPFDSKEPEGLMAFFVVEIAAESCQIQCAVQILPTHCMESRRPKCINNKLAEWTLVLHPNSLEVPREENLSLLTGCSWLAERPRQEIFTFQFEFRTCSAHTGKLLLSFWIILQFQGTTALQ